MRVFSIFRSISGEMGFFHQGSPTIFIRLAGCNARCKMSVKEVVDEVFSWSKDKRVLQVLITGGEALLQHIDLTQLVQELADEGFRIQIETHGSIIPPRYLCTLVDWWVVDYKLPSSGEEHIMVSPQDIAKMYNATLKFVCANKADFMKALEVGEAILDSVTYICPTIEFAFSACPPLTHKELLSWMEGHSDQFPWLVQAGLNVQIYKLIGLVEDSA